MTTKWNVALSLSAGLLGGLLSHWLWPAPAYAQVQVHPPAVIQAQSFALVDSNGNVMGTFSADRSLTGKTHIKLTASGQEIWSAPADPHLVPLVEK
jgi:hypothetical protein